MSHEHFCGFDFYNLPSVSPTLKVWLAAQLVYVAAPPEGMVQPVESPTTCLVCASEPWNKVAAASSTITKAFRFLAMAVCVLKVQIAPVFLGLCFVLFVLLQLREIEK